jgi:hypothetical protein
VNRRQLMIRSWGSRIRNFKDMLISDIMLLNIAISMHDTILNTITSTNQVLVGTMAYFKVTIFCGPMFDIFMDWPKNAKFYTCMLTLATCTMEH